MTRRRGLTLLQMVAAIGVTTGVMTLAVPLVIAAERHLQRVAVRNRLQLELREAAFHFGEDVRQARRIELKGSVLRLDLGDRKGLYRGDAAGLTRSATGAGAPERAEWRQPPIHARFTRAGSTVRAQLSGAQAILGRRVETSISCTEIARAAETGGAE